MNDFGWNDGIETSAILVTFRRKGERCEIKTLAPVYVLGEDKRNATYIPRQDLPGGAERLDLTRVPAVMIGGKRKWQMGRIADFLKENPGFEGAFILNPGTGNWDLGWGHIIVTSRQVLEGRRVSGGRPETQLTNHRWLRDGRYVADRADLLHGKAIKVLATELEQEPGVELIATSLAATFCDHYHPLHPVCQGVLHELEGLERHRVLLTGEQPRDMRTVVRNWLTEQFRTMGVRFVRDIPAEFTLTAGDVEPELVARAEILGTVEIPGLGRRRPESVRPEFGWSSVLAVTLTSEDVRAVMAWPFDTIYPMVEGPQAHRQLTYAFQEVMREVVREERWASFRALLAEVWRDHRKIFDRPGDEDVRDIDNLPLLPEPKVWGHDLLTGEAWTAYPAIIKRSYGGGLQMRWYDDEAEAAEAGAEVRREAEARALAKQLEAELTTEAAGVELPVSVPAAYVAPSQTPEQILAMAGFSAGQYRIRQDVTYWYSSGLRGSRDDEGDWNEGSPAFGSFAQKAGDGVWEIGKSGLSHLLEGGRIGDAYGKAVLGVMGAGEQIPAITAALEAERAAAEEAYRVSVRRFARALQAETAYASLLPTVQVKLDGLASVTSGTPTIDEAEVRAEWAKAVVLERQVRIGRLLTNWGGHFRDMGATGNIQYWVIRPDGSERNPDEVSYRKRYTSEGSKLWRLVAPEELALVWAKAYTADPHQFEVAKLPFGGRCTQEQLATITRIECEISERFHGTVGCSGVVSPEIGRGWGLGNPRPVVKQLAPQPSAAPSQEPTATQPTAPVAEATSFVHQGKRDFRSSCCGAYPQVTKGQAADFQAGRPLYLTCPVCGKAGAATK